MARNSDGRYSLSRGIMRQIAAVNMGVIGGRKNSGQRGSEYLRVAMVLSSITGKTAWQKREIAVRRGASE